MDTTDYDNDADVAVIQLAHASPRGFTAALEAMFAAS